MFEHTDLIVRALIVSLCRHAVLKENLNKLYLQNLTTSATTTMRIIKTMTPATAVPAASTTESDEELVSIGKVGKHLRFIMSVNLYGLV